jgi:hypothetical protein
MSAPRLVGIPVPGCCGPRAVVFALPNQFRPGDGERMLSRGCRLVAFCHVRSVSRKPDGWQAVHPLHNFDFDACPIVRVNNACESCSENHFRRPDWR